MKLLILEAGYLTEATLLNIIIIYLFVTLINGLFLTSNVIAEDP